MRIVQGLQKTTIKEGGRWLIMKRDNYCVLVVADDREIQDAIEIYLKNEGLTVFKAKDGIEAIEKLNEHDIHLIILDIMMPRLNGIATTFKIREQKKYPHYYPQRQK